MSNTTFAELLTEYRRQRGMAAYAVAIEAGIDHAHIYRLEHGKRRPTIHAIARLATAMELSVAQTSALLWAAYTDSVIELEAKDA